MLVFFLFDEKPLEFWRWSSPQTRAQNAHGNFSGGGKPTAFCNFSLHSFNFYARGTFEKFHGRLYALHVNFFRIVGMYWTSTTNDVVSFHWQHQHNHTFVIYTSFKTLPIYFISYKFVLQLYLQMMVSLETSLPLWCSEFWILKIGKNRNFGFFCFRDENVESGFNKWIFCIYWDCYTFDKRQWFHDQSG